jgi:hypothetical protein
MTELEERRHAASILDEGRAFGASASRRSAVLLAMRQQFVDGCALEDGFLPV